MIKRFTLIVSILFTVITSAQEGTTSPYSFYGLGLTTFQGTVENQSMGGLSVFTDSIHLNLRNPASYGKLGLTTFSVAGSHQSTTPKNAEMSGSTKTTSLDYLAIGIPAGKFGFGFGLQPYTSVGYNLMNIDEDEGVMGRYTGKGGLNRVYLSAGFALTRNLSMGVEANYNFGTIRNNNILLREGLQFGTREINESSLRGFGYNLALNYQGSLTDKLQLQAAAIYTPETSITSENERQLATVSLLSDGTETVFDARDMGIEDTELTLPSQYTLGAGLGQPRKWFVGLEYTNVEPSVFNNRSFVADGASYTSAVKYRVGGFYIPDYSSITSYFNRIVYRGGFRMEETGLHLNGEAINEFGISFGVGLPAGRMFENINLGFEYGQRGTTSAGLIQEDFFKLSISLSLSDRWFVKRRFD